MEREENYMRKYLKNISKIATRLGNKEAAKLDVGRKNQQLARDRKRKEHDRKRAEATSEVKEVTLMAVEDLLSQHLREKAMEETSKRERFIQVT